jgi:TonB-linked SusC/RagA family outer membrane protein
MNKIFTPKLWKLMKICAFQGVIAVLLCGVSVAHNGYGQLLDRQVSVSLQEVSFEEALNEIASAAEIQFAYSLDLLKVRERVSLQAEHRALREVLDEFLVPRGIRYKVHEREAIITLKNREEGGGERSLNENADSSLSRLIAVSGTVTDINQQPIAGVNIVVKGTTNGTTTDSDGRYTIGAGEGDVLVFSFIGYASMEVRVNNQSSIDVVLEEDVKRLGEVVVNAGYYTVTDETKTGNISKIDAVDIRRQPVSNSLATLQGRIPGLEITQQTGIPGGNFTVRIRGQNSIGSGNDPLYIIDGVPYTSESFALNETSGEILPGGTSPLNFINPRDIESIEVLKDASSTAIYGSRGANGVILITTKRGQTGKTVVDANFYSGISNVGHFVELLKTDDYLTMRREAFRNDKRALNTANASDLMVWDTTRYTNWQKQLIGGSAHTTDAQLALSGGNERTQFSVSSAYRRETTVFPGDDFNQRLSVHLNLNNTSSNDKLRTVFSISYSSIGTNLLGIDLTRRSLELPPVAPPLYNYNGDLNWENMTWANPLSYLEKQFESAATNLIGNSTISYEVLQGLTVKSNMGFTNTNMDAITTTPSSFYGPPEVAPYFVQESTFGASKFGNWIVEPQVNYQRKFVESSINVLVGTSFLQQTRESSVVTGSGFTTQALMKSLAAAPDLTAGVTNSKYRYNAVFGRINYTLKDRYIVDITGRRDGSSRFGPGKQFAAFGAVGMAWLFSKEPFLQDRLRFLSFGKLRMSYGTAGNDQIGDYEYLDTYSSYAPYMGSPTLLPTRPFNADFAWEMNRKFEVGLEWRLLKDIISGSISYYRNRSSDQLIGYPLPPTTGFNNVRSNFPATVQNSGLEIILNTVNIKTSGFTWTTALNFSTPRNKLLEFKDIEASAYTNTLAVGEPLSIKKLYNTSGVDPVSGIYQFTDVDGDGRFNNSDRNVILFAGTDFFGGLQNSFSLGDFELDFLFQVIKQTGYDYRPGNPGGMINQPVVVMERWQQEGDNTTVQRFGTTSVTSSPYSRYSATENAFVDASFVRLKNIWLSYGLPSALTQKLGLRQARLFLQGQNLLTISDYKGLDPEVPGGTSLPPLRTMAAGVHLQF